MLKKIFINLLVLSTFLSMKAAAEDYGACHLVYSNGMHSCVECPYVHCVKLWRERKEVLDKKSPGFFAPRASCPR
jgi:hypothetical protein